MSEKEPMVLKLLRRSRVTEGGCWEWIGARNYRQYGTIVVRQGGKRVTLRVHREAYKLFSGRQIPEGIHICHRCDNPPCFNPMHLYAGTAKENVRDSIVRKRRNTFCVRCGVPHDQQTTGCSACYIRHYNRRKFALLQNLVASDTDEAA